jgi:hypothetical protein
MIIDLSDPGDGKPFSPELVDNLKNIKEQLNAV